MSSKSREKSGSITHLVKIVATEVFEDLMSKRTPDFDYMKDYCDRVKDYCRMESNTEKAGGFWTAEEDRLLKFEVQAAIAQIAVNHRRSLAAIYSRIYQKDLLNP